MGQVFDKRLHIVIAMLRQSVEPAERTQPQWVNAFEMVGSGLTEPLPPDSPTRAYLAALARASSWAPPTGRTGRTAGTAARAALHGLVVLALPQAAKAQGQGHGFALQIHIADASIWNMLVLIIILLVMLLAVTFCRVLPLLTVGSPPPRGQRRRQRGDRAAPRGGGQLCSPELGQCRQRDGGGERGGGGGTLFRF